MTRDVEMAGRAVKKSSRKAVTPGRVPKTARRSIPAAPSVDDLKEQLGEALAHQAATAEVLRVISSSRGELQPVFEAVLQNATRICEAKFAIMLEYTDGKYRGLAYRGLTSRGTKKVEEFHREPRVWGPATALGRVARTRQTVHIADIQADRATFEKDPGRMAAIEISGVRTLVVVPMLKEGELIGAICVFRQEMRPFSDKQIALLTNFAAQAVIAIESTRLLNDLRESLEQQTATSEVLKVISSSPGDLQPVFETMLENATRICGATFGILFRYEDGLFHPTAMLDVPPAFAEFLDRQGAFPPQPGQHFGRLCESRSVIQMEDRAKELLNSPSARLAGARSAIAVPMLKAGELVGALYIYRTEVRRFTDKQIELVQGFAAQAVIAIENTRLLNELRQRTDELSESLEQQTATSEVLKVISSSPAVLEPVFHSMLENATRICEASFGNFFMCDGCVLTAVAIHGNQDYVDYWRRNPVIDLREHPGVPLDGILHSQQIIHIADLRTDPSYLSKDNRMVSLVEVAGARTCVIVPLLKERELVGVIVLYRQEVRPFADKQIELVQNFAAQAVIAIENTRLLNELRQRTDDLSEALEQQTATSEILGVISHSPTDLQPIFEAMVQSAGRLCEATDASVFLVEGENMRHVASHGLAMTMGAGEVRPITRRRLGGRAIVDCQTIHIHDGLAVTADFPDSRQAIVQQGIRTSLAVPLLQGGKALGVIVVRRTEVRPFTDKQIALLKTFADQAVIAINNVNLFRELRQRTDELAQRQAELRVTFDNMGDGVVMFDQDLRLAAWNRNLQEMMDIPDAFFAESRTYRDYVNYLIERGEFTAERAAELARFDERSMREERFERTRPNGRILEVRRNPVPGGGFVLIFSDITERKQAEERVRAARDAAERALAELRAAQDRLVQTEKLASLGQLTAGIAHEIKNPLNFVNNFSGVSVELIDELQATLGTMKADDKAVAEITELANTLRGNLDKIVQHGQRADAIVRNMLLHSRQGSAEHRPVDINALVEESLNLAYHGARAEQQGFNITLERSLDPAAGEADVFPQDITRVLLNLISNGFYAATRRKAEGNGGAGYEPTLAAATRNLGDRVEIRIRDNGTGIPPEVKEQMFNPFFTTKPAGEGTGLGLSISHDIIVKQHGGSIEVDTRPGEFTEIKITLPRSGVFPTEPAARG